MKQGVQTDTTSNFQQCWELLANNVASVCMRLKKNKAGNQESKNSSIYLVIDSVLLGK